MTMQMHSEVMDEGFTPSRRGRRPMVHVEPLIEQVRAAEGRWVKFEITDAREANSVLRQLGRTLHFETSSETREDGGKNVYARWHVGH